jgi:hypothetical protein
MILKASTQPGAETVLRGEPGGGAERRPRPRISTRRIMLVATLLRELMDRAARGSSEDVDFLLGQLTPDATLAATKFVASTPSKRTRPSGARSRTRGAAASSTCCATARGRPATWPSACPRSRATRSCSTWAVLTDAGLVVVERRGRQRFNHVNAAALRRSYDRWVTATPTTSRASSSRWGEHLEREGSMSEGADVETPRVLRMESELRFRAPPERVFRALTDPDEVLRWFPYTYGENRVQRLVLEPRVGGLQYEDWGDGRGYLYGQVTEWDPPWRYSVRSGSTRGR